MKVTCEKHPELFIHDLGVRFQKGAAEVEDVAILRKLEGLTGFGFQFDGEIPTAQEVQENPFLAIKKAELEQKAQEFGVDLSGCKNNAERAALLLTAMQEDGNGNGDAK